MQSKKRGRASVPCTNCLHLLDNDLCLNRECGYSPLFHGSLPPSFYENGKGIVQPINRNTINKEIGLELATESQLSKQN